MGSETREIALPLHFRSPMSATESVGASSPRAARTYLWDIASPLYAELLSQPDLVRHSEDVGSEARNYSAEEAKEVFDD